LTGRVCISPVGSLTCVDDIFSRMASLISRRLPNTG
jgi:hypothetical protein